ncbi:YbgA family protein [Fervidobacterium sp.]
MNNLNTHNTKPKIVVSRCFFEHTRYDGGIISSDVVKKLEKYCEFVRICAEVEIGLPIPREPIDVFSINNELKLMNKSRTVDLTDKMLSFANSFADKLSEDVDGMILKSKSPSCGLNDAKLYGENGRVISKTAGLFAKTMVERFPNIVIESEMRLTNDKLRFEFFTFIFTHARYRSISSKKEFVEFHSKNKYLFLAKNEKLMREMGKIVAQKGFDDSIKKEYGQLLVRTLKTPIKMPKMVNMLLHVYGHFKENLNADEKAYFMDLLEDYKNNIVSLQTVLAVLKSWALRYSVDYILEQTFFEPYPRELDQVKE